MDEIEDVQIQIQVDTPGQFREDLPANDSSAEFQNDGNCRIMNKLILNIYMFIVVLLGREGHMDLYRKLKEVFGFNNFRFKQKPAVVAALMGHDCFIVMPTGNV